MLLLIDWVYLPPEEWWLENKNHAGCQSHGHHYEKETNTHTLAINLVKYKTNT